jgi:hypothetical protein
MKMGTQSLTSICIALAISGCCCDTVLEKAMDKGYEVLFCVSNAKGKGKAKVDPSQVTGEGEFDVSSGHRFKILKKQPDNLQLNGKLGIEKKSPSSTPKTFMMINDRPVQLVADAAVSKELSERFNGTWYGVRLAAPITVAQGDVVDFAYTLDESFPLPGNGVALPKNVDGRFAIHEEGKEWDVIPGGDAIDCLPDTIVSLKVPKGQDALLWSGSVGKPIVIPFVFLKNTTAKAHAGTLRIEVATTKGEIVKQTSVNVNLASLGLARLAEVAVPTAGLKSGAYVIRLKALNAQHIDDVIRIGLQIGP